MERETKTIEVDGHKFTVKTYATAREANSIRLTYFNGSKVELVGEEPRISEFNPAIQYEVKLAIIDNLVIEMDGTKENIVQRCEDLPEDIFNKLTTQLDELIAKKN